MKTKKYMAGFSLVEILIAMALSVFVGVKLLTSYALVHEHVGRHKTLILLYENAQNATQLLSHAIRDAGYIGCPKLTEEFSSYLHTATSLTPINLKNSLQGFNSDSVPDVIPERIRQRIKKGTEGFLIKKIHPRMASLNQRMSNRTRIIANTHPKFENGNILLMSNCLQADIFRIKEVRHTESQQFITPESPLKNLYSLPAEIAEIAEEAFYIADTGRLKKNGKTIFALYHFDLRGRGIEEELVEDIENMHLYYGALANNILKYLPSYAVTRWQDVYAIKVVLLLNSSEIYSTTLQQIYYFDGQQYISNDQYLRREWQFYVKLRERSAV